jgi:hypothetical protein
MYKEGVWVSFNTVAGSYGVILEVMDDRIIVRWLDVYCSEGPNMTYFLLPTKERQNTVRLISILPPVIAALYEDA